MTTELEMSPSEARSQPPKGRFGFHESRWWKWARRALGLLMVLVAVFFWATGQTYSLLLLGPLVVFIGSALQRGLAAIQGRLELGFVSQPFGPDSYPYHAQAALRAVLVALVIASASMAIIDVDLAGIGGSRTQWTLVALPLIGFLLLQLIPSRPVSRSLNLVAVIVVGFLSFQLVEVNYRSGAEDAIGIAAPFEGEWFIGSGGRSTLLNHHYTPLADQRYAIDLLIERDGKTFEGEKSDLASYYCWDQPILAPADGVVVAAENGHQDWPVGQRDPEFAAGNVVVIDIGDGRYVQLAHLRMGSIPVEAGQAVAEGDVVGRCGNSGNTAEPHLHMQVQDSPRSVNEHQSDAVQGDLNTFPFRFTNATHIRGGTEFEDQTSQLRRNDRVRVDG